MDKIVGWSSTDRRELFQLTETRTGIPAALIEKDFWVCWVLDKIFMNNDMSQGVVFKGGTTLSKVFKVIKRFSEDIDLVIDPKLFSPESLSNDRSKTQQNKFIDTLRDSAQYYIKDTFFPILNSSIGNTCKVSIDDVKPLNIIIRYPNSLEELPYVRHEIILETGPISALEPCGLFPISSYAAEEFPDRFNKSVVLVPSIKAERTFWDKVTILHVEAHRPANKVVPIRYSRHYYDIKILADSHIKNSAFADIDLLNQVVEFKNRCYHSGWASYNTAKVGTMKLVPPEHAMNTLKSDYDQMKVMIFGDTPTFEEIVESIKALEAEINQLPK